MDLKFSAHTYFMMRNSNLNSVSTENQHEILNKFGKCLLGSKLTKAAVFAIRIVCLVQEPFLRMFTLLDTIF